jgi:erythromycin esterase
VITLIQVADMSDKEMPARLAIEAQYARLSEAVRNRDLDALRALHTPEYRELQISGEERNLEEILAEWRDDLAAMIEPNLQTEIHSFALDADEAELTVCSVQTFISSPSTSLRSSNRSETMRRDTWTSTDTGWCLSRSERQAIKSWVDGKLDRETTFSPPLTAEQRAAVVRDLRVRALPFRSVLAGSGFDDLAGLDRLIGDARIVALGEASHGTAEFFQMKHRLLEYLVERKGFTVFAIEGNWPEAQIADRFVKTGEGAVGAALAAMHFWTWQTEEVAALLHWMRHYNATRGEHPLLSFTGFDMQYPQVATKRVIDFLDHTGSADRDAVRTLYDGVETLDKPGSEITAQEYTRLADGARKAFDLIEARRERLVTASTPEEYRDLRQAARVACQALEMRAGILERDRAMAENVGWLVEEAMPGQKIVLWAHNRHVGTNLGGSERSLGDHLRDRYGDQMAVIGFSSHHGEVRAVRIKEGRVQRGGPVALPLEPANKFSIAAVFQETGLPRFILDLRDLPKDSAVGAWLAKPRLERVMGAVYDPDRASTYYEHTRLPETYDGIVFIAESTAAKPLK